MSAYVTVFVTYKFEELWCDEYSQLNLWNSNQIDLRTVRLSGKDYWVIIVIITLFILGTWKTGKKAYFYDQTS